MEFILIHSVHKNQAPEIFQIRIRKWRKQSESWRPISKHSRRNFLAFVRVWLLLSFHYNKLQMPDQLTKDVSAST
jgi:hypothetical protein